MNIIEITPDDVEKFQALRLSALQDSPEAFGSAYETEVTYSLDKVRERLANPQGFTLAAVDSGEWVGMVGFFREHHIKMRHKGWIWGMYTDPKRRGQGVGKLLLTAALDRIRQLDGLEQVNLTVVTSNQAAKTFYEKIGFETWGVEPHALNVNDQYFDEAYMVLRIQEH